MHCNEGGPEEAFPNNSSKLFIAEYCNAENRICVTIKNNQTNANTVITHFRDNLIALPDIERLITTYI